MCCKYRRSKARKDILVLVAEHSKDDKLTGNLLAVRKAIIVSCLLNVA